MASTTAIEDMVEMPDIEAQLLLSTAKVSFDTIQIDEIRGLIDQVSNWDSVVDKSIRKFSAPYLQRALAKTETETIPPEPGRRLSDFVQFTNLRALKTAAAQIAFHRTCIEPLNVRHAYLKGIALYSQFGGNFADRFCRDIDVLVEERAFKDVIFTAVEHGYRVVLSSKPLIYATSRNDLLFAAKFPGDIGLMSSDGVLIEVHRRLDKRSVIFNSDIALDSAVPVKISNVTVKTLHWPLHFTYVCYHHARHFWSHLHWIADLDLMIRSPEFDKQKVDDTADAYRLSPTTDASIEFYRLISKPDSWLEALRKPDLANQFLKVCLINLQGGLEIEYALKQNAFGRAFLSKSQLNARRPARGRRDFWRTELHPTLSQYVKHPLPASTFWLYRIQRALIFARDWIFDVLASTPKDPAPSAPMQSKKEQEM